MPPTPSTAADAILITRPEPVAAETAARVAALGWTPVLAPALVLEPRRLVAPLPPRTQALLLTSRSAARALPPGGFGLPILAVGEATAEEARARGVTGPVLAAPGCDAASLTELTAARLDPGAGPIVVAAGEGYAGALATALRARGFRVFRRVAYAARSATELPAEAVEAVGHGRVVAALFFSPRSARCAISLLRAAGLAATAARAEALAISPRVAEEAATAIAPLAWSAIRVASRPDQETLLALLGPRGPAEGGGAAPLRPAGDA